MEPTYYILFQFLMQKHEKYIFIVFLAGVMFVTLTAFFLYHIWLIWSGLTTNEKFRKTDVMNFYYSRKQLVEKKLTFIEKVILDKQAEKAAKEKSGLKTVTKGGLTAQGEEAEPLLKSNEEKTGQSGRGDGESERESDDGES